MGWFADWFADWHGAWFGVAEEDGGGGSTATGQAFPLIPVKEPEVEAQQERSGPIKIIDKTGRLSKNPANWPAGLKEAIAECCCGESSSTTKETNPCCSGLVLPEAIKGNIRHTKIHDTGLNMRFWPNVLIKFGDSFNQYPEETYPPWIPREAMPFLYSTSGVLGSLTVFKWGGVWYSDFYEDYECNYDLNGYFYISLSPFSTLQVDYHIQMNVKVYYYVTYGLTSDSSGGQVATLKTGCGLNVWQCAYPTGAITFSNKLGIDLGFLLPVPNPLPITYLLNNGRPGVIDAFRSLFNTQSQTSVVVGVGSDYVLFNAATGKYITGQSGYCTDYEPLVCNPFSRTHVFQGLQIGVPGGLDYPVGLSAQCHDLKAINGNPGSPVAYGRPGTMLTNLDAFGLPLLTADDVENFVKCDKAEIVFDTDPFMEVFT